MTHAARRPPRGPAGRGLMAAEELSAGAQPSGDGQASRAAGDVLREADALHVARVAAAWGLLAAAETAHSKP